ncbi:MAG: hypothetical protein ABIJ47_00895 [Candidatus Bathyarchaeota archaeon]
MRKLVRLSPLILFMDFILFAAASDRLVGFRVETDRETCLVGENVTATITCYNYFPFPAPYSAITKVEFGCTLNGEPLRGGHGAHLTPAGPFYFASPGSETWLMPIPVSPQVNGTLVFTARIGEEHPAVYEKKVLVLSR